MDLAWPFNTGFTVAGSVISMFSLRRIKRTINLLDRIVGMWVVCRPTLYKGCYELDVYSSEWPSIRSKRPFSV